MLPTPRSCVAGMILGSLVLTNGVLLDNRTPAQSARAAPVAGLRHVSAITWEAPPGPRPESQSKLGEWCVAPNGKPTNPGSRHDHSIWLPHLGATKSGLETLSGCEVGNTMDSLRVGSRVFERLR